MIFDPLWTNTWIAGTLFAAVAGCIGVFVVLRGDSFTAHAVPQCGFAGAALAWLLGLNTLVGFGALAGAGALGIGVLQKRGRHDVGTALGLVVMLGAGDLFLSFSQQGAQEVEGILFGQLITVPGYDIPFIVALAITGCAGIAILFRPLLYRSALPDVAVTRTRPLWVLDMGFLLCVAIVTTMSIPIVGALLIFSLMVGPPAAARRLVRTPGRAVLLAVILCELLTWVSIGLSISTNLPASFFVGVGAAALYIGCSLATRNAGARGNSLRGNPDPHEGAPLVATDTPFPE